MTAKKSKLTKTKSVGNLLSAPKQPKKDRPNLGPTFGVKTHQLPQHAPRKV